jgi:hypothetical protein
MPELGSIAVAMGGWLLEREEYRTIPELGSVGLLPRFTEAHAAGACVLAETFFAASEIPASVLERTTAHRIQGP